MADLSPAPKFKGFVAGTSTPLAGGKLYTYLAGTLTTQATAKDQAGTANTNPIILDANGECDLWLLNFAYKLVLKDSLDVTQWTVDQVQSPAYQISAITTGLNATTFASLGSLVPLNGAGTIVNLQGHTTAGIGGGQFIAKAGSVTSDGGTQINSATGGLYWQRIGYQLIDVAFFGCVGSGDEYAKLQLAINAAVAQQLPLTGTGTYTSNTVLTASGKIVIHRDGDCVSQQWKITTSSTNELLKITTSASSISGLSLEHNGSSGRVLKLENCEAISVKNCRFSANHATNTDPIIYTHGSNNYINDCRFDNLRPAAFAIDCDRTSYGININSNFDNNYMAGTGKGLLVHSSDASARPEGVSWIDNDLVLTGIHVELQCCLGFTASNNMMDQANPYSYYLNPSAVSGGLEIVQISDRYIATSNTGSGVGIYYNPAAAGALKYVTINDTVIDTASKGVVIFGGNTENINIDNVMIKNTTSEQVSLSGVVGVLNITNCTLSDSTTVTIADGAGGGWVNVDKNYFASGATLAFTKTDAAKWFVGQNFGKKTYFRGAGNFGSLGVGTGTVTATVAHGLYTTPPVSSVYATLRINSGTFTAANVLVESTDATNVTYRLYYTCTVGGVIAFNAEGYAL
jgi:hypothetical protein